MTLAAWKAVVLLCGLIPAMERRECANEVKRLTDASQDVRERAATLLYTACGPSGLGKQAAASLRKSVELGNSSAGAILLLGHFPCAATKAVLEQAMLRPTKPGLVKLQSWGPAAPVALAAQIALTRLGSPVSRDQLLGAVSTGSAEEEHFLLSVLPEIDDPGVLGALSGKLDDEREISGGVPSGATPRPRVCDLAVEAFGAKLKLKYSFRVSPGRRYTASEREEAREKIATAMKQLRNPV